MSRLQSFQEFNESNNWIQSAVKKPGSLRRSLKKKKGEKITSSEIDNSLTALQAKDQDPTKKGVQGLSKKDLALFRKLNLAKTLGSLKKESAAGLKQVTVTEHNDWEGETFSYIFDQVSDDFIQTLRDKMSDLIAEDIIEITESNYTPEKVEELNQLSDNTYMDRFGFYKIPDLSQVDDLYTEVFYKAGGLEAI